MGRAVAVGVVWSGAFYLAETLAQLIFTAVLARLLSPHDYGVVAAANIFIQLANLISNPGINAAIIQMPELDRQRQRVALSIVFVASFLCFAGMLLVAPAAQYWFHMDGLAGVVQVLGLIFLAQALGSLPQALLYRDLHSQSVFVTRFATVVFANVVVAIPMAYAGFGYWSLVAGTLTQAFANSVALYLQVRSPLVPRFSWSEARELMRTASGFSIAAIVSFISLQGDNIIVGRYLGSALLGIYSRAYSLMGLPNTMYSAIAERVVFPAMARVQNDLERLRSAYIQGLAITAFIGIPLSAQLVIFAPELIRVVFGPKWSAAILPFEILSVAMYVRLSWRVSSSLLRSRGELGRIITANSIQAVLVIGGCLATYRYGLPYLSAAVTLSFLAGFSVVSGLACQRVRVSLPEFLRAQIPGALLGGLVGSLGSGTALALRTLAVADYLVLIADILVVGAAALAAILFFPRIFVGQDVAPFLDHLVAMSGLSRLKRHPKSGD